MINQEKASKVTFHVEAPNWALRPPGQALRHTAHLKCPGFVRDLLLTEESRLLKPKAFSQKERCSGLGVVAEIPAQKQNPQAPQG